MSEKRLSVHLGTLKGILRVCVNRSCCSSSTIGFRKFEVGAAGELLLSQGSSLRRRGRSSFAFSPSGARVNLQPLFLRHQVLCQGP